MFFAIYFYEHYNVLYIFKVEDLGKSCFTHDLRVQSKIERRHDVGTSKNYHSSWNRFSSRIDWLLQVKRFYSFFFAYLKLFIYFNRLNAYFLKEATKYQPISEDPSVTKNSMRYRGIDGFIAAVSPFNFTAIGGNLAYTPALMVSSRIFMNPTVLKCYVQTGFYLYFIVNMVLKTMNILRKRAN